MLLILGLIVVVTGAASAAAGAATALGFGDVPVRVVSIAVGTIQGFGFFLLLFRVTAAGHVTTRSMVLSAAITALGWQLLLTLAGVVVAHQLRHAQAVAGLFGVVLGLLAWLALQATVMVYAIEIDVVRSRRLWPEALCNRRSPGPTSPTTPTPCEPNGSDPNRCSTSRTRPTRSSPPP